MNSSNSLHMIVTGRVQGVFFRASTKDQALKLGLTGWVKNCENGSVEIWAEGPESELQKLKVWAQIGPSHANVTDIQVKLSQPSGQYHSFDITH